MAGACAAGGAAGGVGAWGTGAGEGPGAGVAPGKGVGEVAAAAKSCEKKLSNAAAAEPTSGTPESEKIPVRNE